MSTRENRGHSDHSYMRCRDDSTDEERALGERPIAPTFRSAPPSELKRISEMSHGRRSILRSDPCD